MQTLKPHDFVSLDRFERIASLGLSAMHPGGLAATFQLAKALGISPGVRLLDVGCGVGQTARLLAERFRAQVTGLDKSASMIARAKERSPGVTFLEGDAYALPFASESFEILVAESVTLFLERERVLREFHRVLVPGGRIGDIVMTCREPLSAELQERFARLEGVRMCPVSPEEWLADYEAAGFEIVRSTFYPSLSNGATAWSTLTDNGLRGIGAFARFLGLWLTDRGVRAYVRELSELWREHGSRFGYGLIVARRL